MLSEPDRYVEAFAKAGASLITIHIEPGYDHIGTLNRIRDLGCRRGLALNPGTPVGDVEALLPHVDLVLAMTVQPGFGGQSFRAEVLPKIAQLAAWRRERALDFAIEVDGGIDLVSAAKCRSAGADHFVVGTHFFHAADKAAFALAVNSMP
jgi:ribulose-phosphate 3-epimerase